MQESVGRLVVWMHEVIHLLSSATAASELTSPPNLPLEGSAVNLFEYRHTELTQVFRGVAFISQCPYHSVLGSLMAQQTAKPEGRERANHKLPLSALCTYNDADPTVYFTSCIATSCWKMAMNSNMAVVIYALRSA
jgi:hypothetical protein